MSDSKLAQEFCQSPNYDSLDKKLIVVHWMAGPFVAARNFFANKNNYASAHYGISRYGYIIQWVLERDCAWHAGKSAYKNYKHKIFGVELSTLGLVSIGIELEGPPSCIGENSWANNQIDALIKLCVDIKTRWPNVKLVDHSRIAPKRKIDVIAGTGKPEDVFPWEKLIMKTGIPEA